MQAEQKIVKGYYEHYEGELPHDPASEKTLFKLAIDHMIGERGFINYRGCEIGVLNGETSRFFLALRENIYLTGIDPLIPDSMEASLIGSREMIDKNCKPFEHRWNFINDYSYNVVHHFKDGHFDFLFIDGDHTYAAVARDFSDYFPKVREGGLIFFHDSRMYRGGAPFHKGSSKFVEDLLQEGHENTGVKLVGEAFSLTAFEKLETT